MSLRQAHIQMLDRWHWDFFTSNTLRGVVHPEKADKLWRVWICKINRHIFGHRWWKHGKGLYWCRASEYQERGALHFHGLLGGCGVGQLDIGRWTAEWFRLAGIAKMEQPKSKEAVQRYITKELAKGGEIDFGGPLISNQENWTYVVPEVQIGIKLP